MQYKLDTLGCRMKLAGCKNTSNKKLGVYDWLCDISNIENSSDYVEVQFKNTRKEFYFNDKKLQLSKGDWVAVEATPGHDIGEVTMTGKLVFIQMRKHNINVENQKFKKIYRKAKDSDIEKYKQAKKREHEVMIKARQIAENIKLDMKIGDVEFQGDGTKAIFYYIAEGRVDFRQLIKIFAETFRVKIEMKQIGSRQEAGRIGGIGPCGRELCCAKWMTRFSSVSTNSARLQGISINTQKLAGQCGKLKCCLNFESDVYLDAQKKFPSKEIILETEDTQYYHFKNDIFNGLATYSTRSNYPKDTVTISIERAKEVIELNKRGEKPKELGDGQAQKTLPKPKEYENVVGQDSLTRFDNTLRKKRRKKKRRKPNNSNSTRNGNGSNERNKTK